MMARSRTIACSGDSRLGQAVETAVAVAIAIAPSIVLLRS